ncbi:hypothetical protein ABIC45_005072 [Mucilaginibacter rubeus]
MAKICEVFKLGKSGNTTYKKSPKTFQFSGSFIPSHYPSGRI